MLGERPRPAFLREGCEPRKIGGLEEGPHVLVLLFERLPSALLPVDDGEDADDLVAGLLEFLARQEGRRTGGDHVVDRDDLRPARKLVLDFPAGPIFLRLLAGDRALQHFSAGLVREHDDRRGDEVGSHRQAADRRGFHGKLLDFPEELAGDEGQPLAVERDGLAVEVLARLGAGAEDEIALDDAKLLDEGAKSIAVGRHFSLLGLAHYKTNSSQAGSRGPRVCCGKRQTKRNSLCPALSFPKRRSIPPCARRSRITAATS